MKLNKYGRLPPFGVDLAQRQRYKNIPFLVVICAGLNAWPRAKCWNQSPNDCIGMVFPGDKPPSVYRWPVHNCACLIEWNTGPSDRDIASLIQGLITAGAESVTVWPRFTDSGSVWIYDLDRPIGDRWIQYRESIITILGRRGVDYAA